MSDEQLKKDAARLREWQEKIHTANRKNIFCHCRDCDSEWVDSSFEVVCSQCGSKNVESISCWQFPDD
ncbi:hydrogenase maturation nickel metallochaperone HypA [Oscillatoria salina]|uniref:hydrogenase maturation nickel metallochaperone HypA n=1 Tax=Oscillatoria salina TaxID=331517 RepID=UPI0013BBA811|nr:hydrogenase maturation nickel metallochaperone HypA [Oscillatoria salina]MBZ8181178.1 hypothetical protein [Oscillatoria salina IIICB1]NET88877.1 hypothetical protein [Kamptonema sp. SIO1D9]